jgi:hypothetical protein
LLQVLVLRKEMLNGLVDSDLADILSWELEPVTGNSWSRNGVMNVIKVVRGPLLVILDELVVEVSLWEIICSVLVEL